MNMKTLFDCWRAPIAAEAKNLYARLHAFWPHLDYVLLPDGRHDFVANTGLLGAGLAAVAADRSMTEVAEELRRLCLSEAHLHKVLATWARSYVPTPSTTRTAPLRRDLRVGDYATRTGSWAFCRVLKVSEAEAELCSVARRAKHGQLLIPMPKAKPFICSRAGGELYKARLNKGSWRYHPCVITDPNLLAALDALPNK